MNALERFTDWLFDRPFWLIGPTLVGVLAIAMVLLIVSATVAFYPFIKKQWQEHVAFCADRGMEPVNLTAESVHSAGTYFCRDPHTGQLYMN